MKATLTLVYETEIDDDDKDWLKECVIEGDDQALSEVFGVGWGDQKESKIEFE
jgi:hypothetical protein